MFLPSSWGAPCFSGRVPARRRPPAILDRLASPSPALSPSPSLPRRPTSAPAVGGPALPPPPLPPCPLLTVLCWVGRSSFARPVSSCLPWSGPACPLGLSGPACLAFAPSSPSMSPNASDWWGWGLFVLSNTPFALSNTPFLHFSVLRCSRIRRGSKYICLSLSLSLSLLFFCLALFALGLPILSPLRSECCCCRFLRGSKYIYIYIY